MYVFYSNVESNSTNLQIFFKPPKQSQTKFRVKKSQRKIRVSKNKNNQEFKRRKSRFKSNKLTLKKVSNSGL